MHSGSVHVNMAVGVLIEIPSYLFCLLGLNRFGRRPLLVQTQLLTAVSCLGAAALQLWLPQQQQNPEEYVDHLTRHL